MKNNLPEFWNVKNDGSPLFRDTVLHYLNIGVEEEKRLSGFNTGQFYGVYPHKGAVNYYPNKNTITLEQFIGLSKEIEEFTPGQKVLVWDNVFPMKVERFYIGKTKAGKFVIEHPDSGRVTSWDNCEAIKEPDNIQVSVTINGCPANPTDIPKKVWDKMREVNNNC